MKDEINQSRLSLQWIQNVCTLYHISVGSVIPLILHCRSVGDIAGKEFLVREVLKSDNNDWMLAVTITNVCL
jgi:hypothetical protein